LIYDHEGAKGFRVFQAQFQMDMTEKGFQTRDFWGRVIDPWTGWIGFQAGMMDRPFGYEVTSADDIRESPDRGRMSQLIMPAEKDLGAELVIESPKTSPLAKLKNPLFVRLDAGAFNGTGSAASAFTSRKDFIGRIQVRDTIHAGTKATVTISGGGSYYYGGVLQSTPFVFDIDKNTVGALVYTKITDSSSANKKFYTRQYAGVDLQLSADYKIGTTTFRGEFIAGQQPGINNASTVPVAVGNDLYIRKFNGAYVYFVQTFKQKLKDGHAICHDIVLKYDFYNPNSQVGQKDMSTTNDAKLSAADIAYQTIGVGYIFRPTDFFQLQVYYDIIKNMTTHVNGFTRDLNDNMLVIRAQFKFDTEWFNKKVKLI
ncbi:MAG: phosphate-selective porin, partial [Bacteroidota bacterium]|nr:phosphate-selective porin [Bacteroidota bacterium]